MYNGILSFLCLTFCLLLSGCNIPILFWEEELMEVAEDIVAEEEKIQGRSYILRKR